MIFNSIISILLGLLELFYWVCIYFSRRNPDLNWPKVLFIPIGPRTDVAYMNKKELFKSAISFLLWGIHFTVLIVVASYLIFGVFYKNSEPHMVLVAIVCFVLPIACGIFYFSSAYLLIRGVFRRRDYVPKSEYYDKFILPSIDEGILPNEEVMH